jgi:hypothetical protein
MYIRACAGSGGVAGTLLALNPVSHAVGTAVQGDRVVAAAGPA